MFPRYTMCWLPSAALGKSLHSGPFNCSKAQRPAHIRSSQRGWWRGEHVGGRQNEAGTCCVGFQLTWKISLFKSVTLPCLPSWSPPHTHATLSSSALHVWRASVSCWHLSLSADEFNVQNQLVALSSASAVPFIKPNWTKWNSLQGADVYFTLTREKVKVPASVLNVLNIDDTTVEQL